MAENPVVILKQRVWSGSFNIPLTALLMVANLTPLTFLLPQTRTWLYQTLLRAKVFGPKDRRPGTISCGLRVWDRWNAYSIAASAFLVPLLLCLVLWCLLNLSNLWSSDISASGGKVAVAQLLSAGIVGGVAIDVFLIAQLPKLLRPRVYTYFLRQDLTRLNDIDGYFEECADEQIVPPNLTLTIHFVVTNTGVNNLSNLRVSIRQLPSQFVVPGDPPPGTPPREQSLHSPSVQGERVYFPPRNDPLDTAPGASAVYHLLLHTPDVKEERRHDFVLRVASDAANGFAESKMFLTVRPSK